MRIRISGGRDSSGFVAGPLGTVTGSIGVGKRSEDFLEGVKNEIGRRDIAWVREVVIEETCCLRIRGFNKSSVSASDRNDSVGRPHSVFR